MSLVVPEKSPVGNNNVGDITGGGVRYVAGDDVGDASGGVGDVTGGVGDVTTGSSGIGSAGDVTGNVWRCH